MKYNGCLTASHSFLVERVYMSMYMAAKAFGYVGLLSYSFKRPKSVGGATVRGIMQMRGSDFGGHIYGGRIFGGRYWPARTKLYAE